MGLSCNVCILDLPHGRYYHAQGVQTSCWFLSVARDLTTTKVREKIHKKTRQNKTRPNVETLEDLWILKCRQGKHYKNQEHHKGSDASSSHCNPPPPPPHTPFLVHFPSHSHFQLNPQPEQGSPDIFAFYFFPHFSWLYWLTYHQ